MNRYGKKNDHNGLIHREHWLTREEKEAIINFFIDNPLNGYRRLTFMMLDQNIVCCSPKTTYNVLKEANLMGKRNMKPSLKGTGFEQPTKPHEHWHVDVSYINICGTFYYLCSVLDGYSRFIMHHEIRESMKEAEIESIIMRAKDKTLDEVTPRIISDNGPQFIANDFKKFIKIVGMTHVKTSPYYPQSNGKIERWHREFKETTIRPKAIVSFEDAKTRTQEFVDHYNAKRLHSSIGYVTPKDKLEGRAETIFKERNQKLKAASEKRRLSYQKKYPIKAMSAGGYGNAEEQPERQAEHGKHENSSRSTEGKDNAFCADALNLRGFQGEDPLGYRPMDKSDRSNVIH